MARTKKEKDRYGERKNRSGQKYGQAKLKSAEKGKWSLVIAGAVFLAAAGMLALAYVSRGKAAAYIGGLGLTAMLFSWTGFFMAVRGFKERERSYVTCRIAIVCHVIFIAGLTAIFFRGLL